MNEETAQVPANFTGTFYFTNFTDTDFESMWNSVKYVFPANKTVPLIIPELSPLQVQEVRKKFAKELAVLVFYGDAKYQAREAEAPMGSGKTPAIFTDNDLAPFIQRCLEPLPVAQAKTETVETDQTEKKMKKDAKGKRVTKVLEEGDSLLAEGQVIG